MWAPHHFSLFIFNHEVECPVRSFGCKDLIPLPSKQGDPHMHVHLLVWTGWLSLLALLMFTKVKSLLGHKIQNITTTITTKCPEGTTGLFLFWVLFSLFFVVVFFSLFFSPLFVLAVNLPFFFFSFLCVSVCMCVFACVHAWLHACSSCESCQLSPF